MLGNETEFGERGIEVTIDLLQPAAGATGPRDEDDVEPGRPRSLPGSLPKQAFRAVALYRPTNATRCDDRQPSRLVVCTLTHVHDQPLTGTLSPAPEDRTDGAPVTESISDGLCHDGQAESLSRPRRRRFLTMARPERVCIRERNPCLRERRRLLGWNVRFMKQPSRGFEVGSTRWLGSTAAF